MSADAISPQTQPCAKHPDATETFPCARCGNHFCIQCCYSLPDGTICCHDCYARPPVETVVAAPAPRPVSSAPLRVSYSPAAQAHPSNEPVAPGQGCVQHPHVRGLFQCRFCGAKSCPTCDFFFSPDLHACPICAAASSGHLSLGRRKDMTGGLIAGGIGTVLFIVAFAGTLATLEGRQREIVAGVLFLLVLAAGATGAGMAMAAYKKGRSNSIGIWVGLVWNFVLVLGVMGLTFVGLFMKG